MADTMQQGSTPATNHAATGPSAQGYAQVSEAVRQGVAAMKQGGQATSDAMRRAGDATAEATKRGSEAGAETMQRAGAEASGAVRRSTEALAEGQREFAHEAAEQFEEVSRKVTQAAHSTSEDMRAFMALPSAANGGLHDLQQSMTGLIEGVVRTNLRAAQELFRLANPAAFVELQQRFAREYMDALMQGTATLVRATRRTADETLRPLEQQVEQRKRANQDQRFQYAAE